MIKATDLKKVEEGIGLNEVDDYLFFAMEAIGIDSFAIKVKDFEQENPTLYGEGESFYEEAHAHNLVYWTHDTWAETLQDLFGMIAYGLDW
ncbi:hypothetical protein [Isobaculum melis]|uniref:Uncharacterized protein n=1 Tax=Isobaculum melis TaxID=142588 RepID=A0A1H9PS78_9LACT|nr:hypothetical protein [Isobaculum melis]SER51081.1 hypothetical protein SAMN04488559_101106 [Isobaculum melis]